MSCLLKRQLFSDVRHQYKPWMGCNLRNKFGSTQKIYRNSVRIVHNTQAYTKYGYNKKFYDNWNSFGYYSIMALGVAFTVSSAVMLTNVIAENVNYNSWNFICPYDDCHRMNIRARKKFSIPGTKRCKHCREEIFVEDYDTWWARRVGRLGTAPVSFLGPGYKLIEGLSTGDGFLATRGFLSLIGDVVTLGASSPALSAVEFALDVGPDVLLTVNYGVCGEWQAALIGVVGLGLSSGAFNAQLKEMKAGAVKDGLKTAYKEGRKSVSDLARKTSQGVSGEARRVTIGNVSTISLPKASRELKKLYARLVKAGLSHNYAKQCADIAREIEEEFEIMLTDHEALQKLAEIEVNAWAQKTGFHLS